MNTHRMTPPQRQQTHPAGTFARCGCCHKEPRHIVARGSGQQMPAQFRAIGERHQLETACGRRTGWLPSLADAIAAWGALGETLPLALVQRPAGNVRALRLSQGRAQG